MWFSQQVRPGIWVGFTDSTAGNLAFHVGDDPELVAARREGLEVAIARTADATTVPALAYMNQVHGADVAVLRADALAGRGPGAPTADAMVLVPSDNDAEVSAAGLAVMVADCVPVVLVGDRPSGPPVVAVAHAGRPGVEKNVIGAVVANMRLVGAESIEAWLGPSVCGQCYEVPEDMRSAVSRVVPQANATTSWGTPSLDLPAAVLAQLKDNGAVAHPSGLCTLEDPGHFSHRRAQRDGEAEGRFIGFVAAMDTAPDADSAAHISRRTPESTPKQ